jgi:hypothetical protein
LRGRGRCLLGFLGFRGRLGFRRSLRGRRFVALALQGHYIVDNRLIAGCICNALAGLCFIMFASCVHCHSPNPEVKAFLDTAFEIEPNGSVI